MHMFRIENIKNSSNKVLWENPSLVSSNSGRPVMLLMGKETRKSCEIVASIQRERTNAKLSVDYQDKSLNAIVDARMSMVDGKLHSLITGLGGAFCCLCTSSEMFWLFQNLLPTAGHLKWSEAKLDVENCVGHTAHFLKQAKEEIQARVKEQTSITLERPDPTGHGGTSTTGNIAALMLNTDNRKLWTQGIASLELQEAVEKPVLNMAVITERFVGRLIFMLLR
eukprot:gene10105-18762_t